MFYQPPRALGLSIGALLSLWSLGIALLLLNTGLGADVGFVTLLVYIGALLTGVLALVFGYWTFALATLSYEIDRNGLLIRWGATRQVVPLGAIEKLVPGEAVGVPRVRGVSWWGHHVGTASIERIGDVLFYSTHQTPDQVLYVMTPEENYAISVEDRQEFAKEIMTRQDLGPTAEVSHHVERSGAAAQAFAHDPLARMLAGAVLLATLLVWAQVVLRYGSMPAALELHFPPSETLSLVTLTGREAIFEIPKAATAIAALNVAAGIALHAWDRVAGYVLLIAAGVLQVGFFAAVAIALA